MASDVDRFGDFLGERVGHGDGVEIMERAITAPAAPSRKLLDYTAKMVAGEPSFRLIDEQLVAFKAVLSLVRRAQRERAGENQNAPTLRE